MCSCQLKTPVTMTETERFLVEPGYVPNWEALTQEVTISDSLRKLFDEHLRKMFYALNREVNEDIARRDAGITGNSCTEAPSDPFVGIRESERLGIDQTYDPDWRVLCLELGHQWFDPTYNLITEALNAGNIDYPEYQRQMKRVFYETHLIPAHVKSGTGGSK